MIFSNVRKELPVAQRLRGQNHFNASPNKYKNKSNYTRNIDRESIAIWKFLAADVESIESVGAVGAVFEEVFFRFGKFLAAFVFAKAVAAAAYAGCLNRED